MVKNNHTHLCIALLLLYVQSSLTSYSQTNYNDEFLTIEVIDSAAVPRVAENIRNEIRAMLLPTDGYETIMSIWNETNIENKLEISRELKESHTCWLKEWKKKLSQLRWKNKSDLHKILKKYTEQHPFVLLPEDKEARAFYRAAIAYNKDTAPSITLTNSIIESYNNEKFSAYAQLLSDIEVNSYPANSNNLISTIQLLRKNSRPAEDTHLDELNKMLTEEYPLNDLTISSIKNYNSYAKGKNAIPTQIIKKEDFELLRYIEIESGHLDYLSSYSHIVPKKHITLRNPNYNPWHWLEEGEFKHRHDTYPIEDSYKISEKYPEYQLRNPENIDYYSLLFKGEEFIAVKSWYEGYDGVIEQIGKIILKEAYEDDKYGISQESILVQNMIKDYIYSEGSLLTNINKEYKDRFVANMMLGGFGVITEEEFYKRTFKNAAEEAQDPKVAAAETVKRYIEQIKSDTPSIKTQMAQRIDGRTFLIPVIVGDHIYNVTATVSATLDKNKKCHDSITYEITKETRNNN